LLVQCIPSAEEVLAVVDMISIDCGANLDGWHGDSAWTFGIGAVIEADRLLSEATRLSMEAGIAAMLPGNRLTDVSHAIELGTRAPGKEHGRAHGLVARYGGHGLGRGLHTGPCPPHGG